MLISLLIYTQTSQQSHKMYIRYIYFFCRTVYEKSSVLLSSTLISCKALWQDLNITCYILSFINMFSGPCKQRQPILQSQGGLLWGCGLILGCKMYTKYYLVKTSCGHIREVSLISGVLSSQGPL